MTGKLFYILYGNVQCPLSGVPLNIQGKENEFNTERAKGYVERKHVRISWYIVIRALFCSKIPDPNSLKKLKDNSVDKGKLLARYMDDLNTIHIKIPVKHWCQGKLALYIYAQMICILWFWPFWVEMVALLTPRWRF